MTNLQPVAIVDKNGRAATVHRRSDNNASMGKTSRSPLPAPQNATQGTPLKTLVPATTSQVNKLVKEFSTSSWPIGHDWAKRMSRKDITLIRRILDNPAVSKPTVYRCVYHGIRDETILREEVTNTLLILEQMYLNGDGKLIEDSEPAYLYASVLGVDQVGTRYYLDKVQPITTQEELESKAAYAAFVFLAVENHVNDDSILRTGLKQFNYKWQRDFLTPHNKHLRQLVLDLPDKQHEITDYIRSRGMHQKNKKPVDALRAYLDDDQTVPSVRSGWL